MVFRLDSFMPLVGEPMTLYRLVALRWRVGLELGPIELVGDSLLYLVVKIEGSEGLDEGIYRV